MNDIAEVNTQENLPAITEERSMLRLVADMAKDPKTDPAKMREILDIQLMLMDRQAKIDFNSALSDAQAAMPSITKRGEIKNREGKVVAKYMKYEDIDAVIKPIIHPLGFSLKHTRHESGGQITIVTTLKHRGGHEESVAATLPHGKTNALTSELQAAVGTFSVGRRVNVCSLFDIVAEDEDSDIVSTGAIKIDDSQAEEIKTALRETGSDETRFLSYMGVKCVEDIPMKDYPKAYMALKRKVLSK